VLSNSNLESTHRGFKLQTSAKEYVLVRNVKLVHNIEIRLITKIVGNVVIGKEEIIFQDLDQNADHLKV